LITALAAVGPRATAAGEGRDEGERGPLRRRAATRFQESHYEGVRDVSARFEQTTIAVKLGASPSMSPAPTELGRGPVRKPRAGGSVETSRNAGS